MDSSDWPKMWNPVTEDKMCGWVGTLEESEKICKTYEVAKSVKFVTAIKKSKFGKQLTDLPGKYKVRFHDVGENKIIPFEGVPFFIVSKHILNCQYGNDSHRKRRERRKEEREKALELQDLSDKEQKFVRGELRDDFRINNKMIKMEHRIYIKFPKDEDHDQHIFKKDYNENGGGSSYPSNMEQDEGSPAQGMSLDLPLVKRGPVSLKSLSNQCTEKLSRIYNSLCECRNKETLMKLLSMLDEALSYVNQNLCNQCDVQKQGTKRRVTHQNTLNKKKQKLKGGMQDGSKTEKNSEQEEVIEDGQIDDPLIIL